MLSGMLRNECLKKSYNDRLYYYPRNNVGISFTNLVRLHLAIHIFSENLQWTPNSIDYIKS